jgi:hypothetical protein
MPNVETPIKQILLCRISDTFEMLDEITVFKEKRIYGSKNKI